MFEEQLYNTIWLFFGSLYVTILFGSLPFVGLYTLIFDKKEKTALMSWAMFGLLGILFLFALFVCLMVFFVFIHSINFLNSL